MGPVFLVILSSSVLFLLILLVIYIFKKRAAHENHLIRLQKNQKAHSARLQRLISMFSPLKFINNPILLADLIKNHCIFMCFLKKKKKQRSMIQINGVFKRSTVYWAPSVNISAISVYLEGRCPGHYLLAAWQYHQSRRVRRGLFFVF